MTMRWEGLPPLAAGQVQWRYDVWTNDCAEHPQTVIMRHFPDAQCFVPQSIADCWWFDAAPRDDPPPGFEMR